MANILVISHTPSHPTTSGNRSRINSLLESLKNSGHDIYFFFLDCGNGDNEVMANTWDRFWKVDYTYPKPRFFKRITDFISKTFKISLYVPFKIDDWYTEDISKKLNKIKEEFELSIVIVEYVFFSKAFHLFNEQLKILDTHDVFGNRHKLFLKNKKRPSWFYTTPIEEKKAIQRADITLAIQENENKYFSDLDTDSNILTVGHLTKIFPIKNNKFNKCLLFIGSGNDINIDAIKYFLTEVWPEVINKHRDAKLLIAGKICHKLRIDSQNCEMLGEVSVISDCYQNADIVINPVRFGTGLKIKNIEALGFGLPLLTTPVGAEGLDNGIGEAFLVAKTSNDFIENCCHLLEDENLRQSLSSSAIKFAESYNQSAVQPLLNAIEKHTIKWKVK